MLLSILGYKYQYLVGTVQWKTNQVISNLAYL